MKALKVIAAVLLLAVCLTAAATAINNLTGETKHKTEEIYPGVLHRYVEVPSSSPYKLQKINIIEFDLAQKDLYFDVVYPQDCAVKLATTKSVMTQFTKSSNGKTAIAGVNGDLWMVTYAHARVEGSGTKYGGYSDAVVKKSFPVSRGFNMSDGEIYSTAHMTQETPYEGEFWSFGVTDDYVPVMGNPQAKVMIKDENTGKEVKADGINRLPANNALVVYTDKAMKGLNNFALDDAYEILIEFDDDYKMCHGADFTGTVKAIYGPDTSENPAVLNKKQMVLTARGNRVSYINEFKVGDKINITCEITDKEGNSEAWQRVTNCVGGHIEFVVEGRLTGNGVGEGANYPSTIIGYTTQKKVVMITIDGRQSGYSVGASSSTLVQLAKDLDLYNAFLVDGGGSTTMTVANANDYKELKTVNSPSDGKDRTVNNSVILSFGPERGEQGEFEIEVPEKVEIDMTNLTFPSKAYADAVAGAKNECSYEWENGDLKMTATELKTNDPFMNINYQFAKENISADEYKIATIVYKIPETNARASYSTEIFFMANGAGAEGGQSAQGQTKRTGKYEYVNISAKNVSKWKGTATGIRLDFFTSATEGDVMYVHNIMFSKTEEEADEKAAYIVGVLNGEIEETTAETTEPETTEPETTEAVTTEADTTTEAVTTAETTTETVTTADTAKAPETDTDKPVDDGKNTVNPVVIICIVAAGVIITVVGVIIVKKKK